ncbi:MAG: hypothetical protein IT364_09275 [Candidatus Hydrogenedentes bacterium]|nr:hypothetical protein [Candidatus Hydrogenedentota bacterium]
MDAYVFNMAKDFAQRHGNTQPIGFATPQHDSACEAVYSSILRTFPSDVLVRWFAATRHILDYGLHFTDDPSQEWTPNPVVYGLFQLRWRLLGWQCGYGMLIAGICAVVLSVMNVRYGLAFLFFILYFAGYSCLQFAQRHFFHLEVAFWWPFFFLLTQFPRWILHRLRSRWLARKPGATKQASGIPLRVGLMRIAVVAAFLVLAAPVPVLATRVYQDAVVTRLLDQYKALPLTAVNAEVREEGGKALVSFSSDHTRELDDSETHDEVFASYFVLEFQVDRPFWFWTRYEAADRANDFRQRVQIDPPGTADSIVRYYLPVYEAPAKSLWGRREFLGLTMEKDPLELLRGVYKVTDLEGIDLLLPLWLTPSGATKATHATTDPGALPFYPRWRAARSGNLIVNGEFDAWSPDGVPDGFGAPQGKARVESVLYPAEAGRCCVRLTWPVAPGPTALNHRFRTQELHLDASSEYELFVDAYNPSSVNVHLSAWQVVRDPSGAEQLIRLSPTAILVEPSARFLTKAGRFFTREVAPADVIIAVDCAGDAFPAVVYLDNFRLIRIE